MGDGVEPRYQQSGPPMSGFGPAWHPQPAALRALPPQPLPPQPQYGASPWGHPVRPVLQGGPMPQGAGPLISWRPPASRQPSRGPQGLVVLMALLVPVLLIIGVAAVVNRSPREVTGPEVTWPPEVQATRTSEARATRTSEARPTRTPEARATRTSETRPPTPEPTISFPQVEVPPLPSWLPSHVWEELPTTGDKVSDKLVAHPNQQDELSRREPSCSTEGVQESRTAHRLLHVRDQLSSGRVVSLPDRSRHPTEARRHGRLRLGRQYPLWLRKTE